MTTYTEEQRNALADIVDLLRATRRRREREKQQTEKQQAEKR